MENPQELIEKVKQLFDEEKYQEIIDLLPDELLVKYNNVELYFWRGMTFDELNDLDKAIQNYNKVIEINPKHLRAYNNRGIIWSKREKLDKAIEEYNKAIEIDPLYPDPYNNLGITWRRKGKLNKAIEEYNKAIEIEPNNELYYNNRGVAWQEKEEFDKAIEDYNKVIEIDPENEIAYNNCGNANQRKGELDKAIKDYNKAIEIKPKYEHAYYNRANAWKEKGEFKKATEDYKKYLEVTSNKNDYWAQQAKAAIEELEQKINIPAYNDITNIVEQIKELLIFEEDCITHYTSLSTAKILILNKGIKENDIKSKFRLSEGAFLNDTSEGRALFDFLNNFHITEKTADKTIAEHFTEKPFIGSFVPNAKHDDLTLWRMYGKESGTEAKGCALTINREKFVDAIQQSIRKRTTTENSLTSTDFTFYRVAYLDKNKENISFIIPGATKAKEKVLNDLMKQLMIQVVTVAEKDKIAITEKLNEIAYLFKSADYLFEHEVRLIIDGVGFEKKFDNETPKVYIELVDIRPALNQITLGPKIERAEEWAATFNYYIKQNYEDQTTDIVISHLPFK